MTPAVRFLMRLSLVASMVIIGAAVGGMAGGLAAGEGGSGFDGLGAVLGGIMVGAFVGVVVAMILVRRSRDDALGRTAVVTLLVAGALVAWGATRASQEMARAEATQSPRSLAPTEPPR